MTRRGRFRGSTAQTYLRAVRGNPNLRIVTDAQAGTLIFDGRKCVGVIYRQGGQMKEIRATKEVILCGGAYNSPHLLQISGIGPAAHLKEIGLEGPSRPAGGGRQSGGPLGRAHETSRAGK